MKAMIKHILVFGLFVVSISGYTQETIQLEVAPYFVPCEDRNDLNCLQILDVTGENLRVIANNDIKGFTAETGYEYTLDVKQFNLNDDVLDEQPLYVLQKEVSKMWVPQFATNAPILKGNFQVVGFNGHSINTNDLTFVINADGRVMNGSTGCNNYHLFFEQLGYSLVFSKILATHLFCASRAAMEEEYYLIFNSVHHFDLKGDVLRLYDISDRNLLEAIRLTE